MSYGPYPQYKESGVEWLGEVPEHWNLLPCRSIVTEQNKRNTEGLIAGYLSLMANVGVIPYEEKGDVGNKKPDDLSKCKVVQKGDLVINSMNYGIGSYGLSKYTGVCSPVYIVLEPKKSIVDTRFALRIFEEKSFQSFAQSFGNGILAHRSAIGWDDLKNIGTAIPPLKEQSQIARFLDHETGKIDGLIAEQEKLIELLKEKRQAVISHAVTKGLDPTVPMKDSGVEWLGEVPAHWVVSKIGFRARLQGGFAFSADMFTTVGVPVVKMNSLKRGVLELSEAAYVSEEFCDERFALHVGDVLFGMSGSIGPTGSLGNYAVVSECDIPAMLNQRVGRFVLSTEEVHPGFMTCVLCSRHFNEQVQLLVTGTAQFNISSEQVESCLSVFPPVHEQAQIAHFLVQETSRFDTLLSEAENGIALLNERRSALISAAVTGKIDVRNWKPEGEAA